MPRHESTTSLEQEIVRLKSDIARVTRDRNLALRAGRREEGERHHLTALETEVRHLAALAKYVQAANPATGRELASRQAIASQHFQRVKASGNPHELRRWVTGELAPLMNKSEQAAHLVASLTKRQDGLPARSVPWKTTRDH